MAKELRSRTISIPAHRNAAVWKAWEKLAIKLTPQMPTDYVMRPSHLFVLIGEAAINNPDKVAAGLRHLLELEQ